MVPGFNNTSDLALAVRRSSNAYRAVDLPRKSGPGRYCNGQKYTGVRCRAMFVKQTGREQRERMAHMKTCCDT
jgi:hypothetical protein